MSLLTFWVSSPDTHSERRLATDLTVLQLKGKLEQVTGIPYQSQVVRLQRTSSVNAVGHGGAGEGPGEKEVLAVLDDDDRTLASYGAREWMTLRVDNIDPNAKSAVGQYTDVSRVEKFELTTQEYEQRSDTVKAYKERHKLGRFAPSTPSTPEPAVVIPPDLIPGARCEVALSEELSRRGTVRFVGPTEFGAKDDSVWVGVEWDEPVGKGDGLVDGKRYFQTPPLRASFVRPDKTMVGDFPELDPFADDDMEISVMPAIPSPLYIISQGPGFTYVPLPWTCPPSHLSWGGGVRPWSIYSIDMTEYKLDPSHPLFATTHEILMDTRDTDMFLEDGDRYAVNRTMASLVVDSTGAFALSNASVVQMFDPHVCSK
ncbi:hypothetical protein RQP46_005212 [Phenoliferia psychrophenolica]